MTTVNPQTTLTVVVMSALLGLRQAQRRFTPSAIQSAGLPTQTTGLIRQIPRHCQIPVEAAADNDVSISLDQQGCNCLITRHRAADTKRVDAAKAGIQSVFPFLILNLLDDSDVCQR
jgi:hypothetical protein